MKIRLLSCTALAVVMFGGMPASQAETVTTKTYVQAQDVDHINEINFRVFDVNNDGVYSMKEVGDRLFESFDRDHNNLIDNHEFGTKSVITITPMEKETYKFVDYDNDGIAEESSYTYQTFYEASGLMRFDENHDGLSAAEFIGKSLQELDDNEDNMITKEEWAEAYKQSRMEHEKQESYN